MYYFRTIILFYYNVNELCLPGCELRVFLLLYQLPVRITDYSSFSFVLVPVVNVIYDDDIVLCSTRREEVENKLEEWRRAMEDRGLEISRKKPVYLRFNGDWNLDGNSDVNLLGENLECVNCIRNLFPYQLCHWMSCGL